MDDETIAAQIVFLAHFGHHIRVPPSLAVEVIDFAVKAIEGDSQTKGLFQVVRNFVFFTDDKVSGLTDLLNEIRNITLGDPVA